MTSRQNRIVCLDPWKPTHPGFVQNFYKYQLQRTNRVHDRLTNPMIYSDKKLFHKDWVHNVYDYGPARYESHSVLIWLPAGSIFPSRFRPQKISNDKQWKKVEFLASHGFRFQKIYRKEGNAWYREPYPATLEQATGLLSCLRSSTSFMSAMSKRVRRNNCDNSS